jgi:hypothetical protein
MNEERLDPRFWDRADAIIHLANKQCGDAPNGKVSASLLYAAARFNAFIVATNAKDADEMKTDKKRAIKYFTDQYRKMLIENLDDYIKSFDRYSAEWDT